MATRIGLIYSQHGHEVAREYFDNGVTGTKGTAKAQGVRAAVRRCRQAPV
jgi:hypothetical protein